MHALECVLELRATYVFRYILIYICVLICLCHIGMSYARLGIQDTN